MPKVRDATYAKLSIPYLLHGTCFLSMILSFSLGGQAVGSIYIPRKKPVLGSTNSSTFLLCQQVYIWISLSLSLFALSQFRTRK